MLAVHVVTTIHCIVREEEGTVKAARILSAILKVFGVAT
jgi:hypothetical protein